MAVIDIIYRDVLQRIFKEGYDYEDPNRKGVFRKEITNVELRYELEYGLPILTTKKTFFKGAVAELLFFLSGSTDIRDLWKRGVNFWDKDWANFHEFDEYRAQVVKDEWIKDGYASGGVYDFSMGRIYPAQYRAWAGATELGRLFAVDQLSNVVKTLKDNPMSTSMIVNAWNPAELNRMCLPPCHYGFQIVGRPLTVKEREQIYIIKIGWAKDDTYRMESLMEHFDKANVPRYGFEVHWQQRSTDFFLGTPINVQYYALLAGLLEILTGHRALAVQGDLKNVHLYDNQFEAAKEVIDRSPTKYEAPNLELSDYLKRVRNERHYEVTTLDEILEGIQVSDFILDDYESYPPLRAEMLARDVE